MQKKWFMVFFEVELSDVEARPRPPALGLGIGLGL